MISKIMITIDCPKPLNLSRIPLLSFFKFIPNHEPTFPIDSTPDINIASCYTRHIIFKLAFRLIFQIALSCHFPMNPIERCDQLLIEFSHITKNISGILYKLQCFFTSIQIIHFTAQLDAWIQRRQFFPILVGRFCLLYFWLV